MNIGDVARHLGVSRSTVSYALTGKRPVSEETKRRVQEAIRELDFFPSTHARALAHSRSYTLAALAPIGPSSNSAVALQFINGTAQASRLLDHDLLLVVGDEAVEGIDRLLRSDQADGLILFDVAEDDPRIEKAAMADKPVVMVGCPSRQVPIDCVDLDWAATGEVLVNHLLELGHRSIGLLGAHHSAYAQRLAYAEHFRTAAIRTAEAAGCALHEFDPEPNAATTPDSLQHLFAKHSDITALVIQHEPLSRNILTLLAALGVRAPDDVSLVNVGLDTFVPNSIQQLSGVDSPSAAVTWQAVNLLIERIEGDAPESARRILLSPQFVDRGSTAAIS